MQSKMTKIKYNGLIRRAFGVSHNFNTSNFRETLNRYRVSNIKVISQEVFLLYIDSELLKLDNLKKIKGVGIGKYK